MNAKIRRSKKKSDATINTVGTKKSESTTGGSVISKHSGGNRNSFYENLKNIVAVSQKNRKTFKLNEIQNGEEINLTPKILNIKYEHVMLDALESKMPFSTKSIHEIGSSRSIKSGSSTISRSRGNRGLAMRLSMDDVIAGIGSELLLGFASDQEKKEEEGSVQSLSVGSADIQLQQKYLRVSLKRTSFFLLYEHQSTTVPKNSEEGNEVEKDNKLYDYLTIGRGRVRRRSDAITQTYNPFRKSRESNTERIEKYNAASYVSFYEMFDTYKALEKKQGGRVTIPKVRSVINLDAPLDKQLTAIKSLPSFNFATMIMGRILSSNEFGEHQRRFRNMDPVDRMAKKVNYRYHLKYLFKIMPYCILYSRRAVSDICFVHTNSDIFAVGYGIYAYRAARQPKSGQVCIWNIKNPYTPERYYFYDYPVTSLEFSPFVPNLLAVGLYDGSVEVRDITNYNEPALAVSQRTTTARTIDPILAIKWIKQGNDNNEVDPFLALSQDGSVIRYSLINSPYLVAFKQIVLEQVEGVPEGLPSKVAQSTLMESNRRPQGLNLTQHPVQTDIYYVLTNEGCLHKCSTNYQNQYLQLLKTHEGAVNCMDFSPWSPKLFLTCGNDWCIRIWMDGILKPIITLKNLFMPYQWTAWSRTHSTIIVGVNKECCEIWDLRRSILKPISSTEIEQSSNTLAKFSLDGTCIAIGNEKGNVIMHSFEDMPFPPYYQYDAIEKAIYKAVSCNEDLLIELKSIGYFGYPNKAFIRPP